MLAGRPELKALAAPGIIGRRLVPHCVELNRQLAVPLERDRQLSTDRHGRLRAHVRVCACVLCVRPLAKRQRGEQALWGANAPSVGGL